MGVYFGLSTVSISMKICNDVMSTQGTSSGGSATDTSPDAVHAQSQRRPSLSSEDLTDEDESFVSSSISNYFWYVPSL